MICCIYDAVALHTVLLKQMFSETLNNTLNTRTYKDIHIVFTYYMLNCLCLLAIILDTFFHSCWPENRHKHHPHAIGFVFVVNVLYIINVWILPYNQVTLSPFILLRHNFTKCKCHIQVIGGWDLVFKEVPHANDTKTHIAKIHKTHCSSTLQPPTPSHHHHHIADPQVSINARRPTE